MRSIESRMHVWLLQKSHELHSKKRRMSTLNRAIAFRLHFEVAWFWGPRLITFKLEKLFIQRICHFKTNSGMLLCLKQIDVTFILKPILPKCSETAPPWTEHLHPRNHTDDLLGAALLCRLQQGVLDVYLGAWRHKGSICSGCATFQRKSRLPMERRGKSRRSRTLETG